MSTTPRQRLVASSYMGRKLLILDERGTITYGTKFNNDNYRRNSLAECLIVAPGR